jgi:hypothetical protein
LEAVALVAVLAAVTVLYRSPQRPSRKPALSLVSEELPYQNQKDTAGAVGGRQTGDRANDFFAFDGGTDADSKAPAKNELALSKPSVQLQPEFGRGGRWKEAAPAEPGADQQWGQLTGSGHGAAPETRMAEVNGLADGQLLFRKAGTYEAQLAEESAVKQEEVKDDVGLKLGKATSETAPAPVTAAELALGEETRERSEVGSRFESAGLTSDGFRAPGQGPGAPVAAQISVSATNVDAARRRVTVVTENNQGRVLAWDGRRQVVQVELPAANLRYFQDELVPPARPPEPLARRDAERARSSAAQPAAGRPVAGPVSAGESNAPAVAGGLVTGQTNVLVEVQILAPAE